MVRVKLLPEGKVVEVHLPERATVRDLLRALGLSSETHVVLVSGTPVPETERVGAGEIVVVRVLSGGQV